MSRIEIAMEKAAKQREGKGPDDPTPLDVLGDEMVSSDQPILEGCAKNPYLVNLHDPLSDTAEEYRKLKLAMVEIASAQEGFKNTFAVTSSVAKEGKTLTALNLAISLAKELDHRVLLIDADLRNPSLHRYLEMGQGVGLSDLLLDRAKLRDTMLDTGIGKLSILPAGTKVDNPAELFTSARMRTVVEQLKRAFPDRYLIFDTAPVLPFAETRSLAHLVDGVLFVVMERIASQSNVREALDSLKGCRIYGTVYNAALLSNHDDRYPRYYRYHKKEGEPPSAKESADLEATD